MENTPDVTKSTAKFLVDGMLGSIARKLRILGFDTIYDSESNDRQLLAMARETGRYLVTSDHELFISSKRLKVASILVTSRSEKSRLFEIFSKTKSTGIPKFPLASRCSVCNGELFESRMREDQMQIYTCKNCGKDFWHGSHWKKLTVLFSEVQKMLENPAEGVNRLDSVQ